MESKHTKGPWYYENYAGYYLIQSEAGYSDTDILNEDTTDKAEANARLCAAAPDLLEALIEIRANMNSGDSEELFDLVNKVIAKATE